MARIIVDLAKAVQSLRPNASFYIWGEEYEGLHWQDEVQTKPTKEECLAEMDRLQAVYDKNQYQSLRAEEYPTFAEQFDVLYHEGYDGWKALIQKVKDKYPKP